MATESVSSLSRPEAGSRSVAAELDDENDESIAGFLLRCFLDSLRFCLFLGLLARSSSFRFRSGCGSHGGFTMAALRHEHDVGEVFRMYKMDVVCEPPVGMMSDDRFYRFPSEVLRVLQTGAPERGI